MIKDIAAFTALILALAALCLWLPAAL